MSMTPIHRIPQDGEVALATAVNMELTTSPITPAELHSELEFMLKHDDKSDSLGILFDWAMQIRAEFGYDWASCIRAAGILYYG